MKSHKEITLGAKSMNSQKETSNEKYAHPKACNLMTKYQIRTQKAGKSRSEISDQKCTAQSMKSHKG
jgi:hypothetical protein